MAYDGYDDGLYGSGLDGGLGMGGLDYGLGEGLIHDQALGGDYGLGYDGLGLGGDQLYEGEMLGGYGDALGGGLLEGELAGEALALGESGYGYGGATSLVGGHGGWAGAGAGPGPGALGYANDLSYGVGGGLGGLRGVGGLGYDGLGGGLGRDLLYDDMDFVDRELPLVEAWGGANEWGDEQYGLADLMYYQRQLEEDRALSEAERISRWEMRLRFEELADEQRAIAYRRMSQQQLASLGLYDGYWARQLGGRRELSLDHLHRVPLTRGLFGAPYRNLFHRHRGLLGRYRPLLSRDRLRPWGSSGGFSGGLGGGLGGGGLGLRSGLGLRDAELATRIRIAEGRANLTSLSSPARSAALRQAAELQRQLSEERRINHQLANSSVRENALALATQEAQRETDAVRDEGERLRLGEIVRGQQLAGQGLVDPRVAALGRSWY